MVKGFGAGVSGGGLGHDSSQSEHAHAGTVS